MPYALRVCVQSRGCVDIPRRWHPKRMKPTRYGSAKTSPINSGSTVQRVSQNSNDIAILDKNFFNFDTPDNNRQSGSHESSSKAVTTVSLRKKKDVFRSRRRDTCTKISRRHSQETWSGSYKDIQGQIRITRVQFKDKWIIVTDTTARFRESEWMKLPKHPHYAISPSVCSIERMRRHLDRWHPKRMKPTQGMVQQRHRRSILVQPFKEYPKTQMTLPF